MAKKTKKEILIALRSEDRTHLEDFLEIVNSDPLNDLEIDCENSFDEILRQLIEVDLAVLTDAVYTLDQLESSDQELGCENEC